jgi:hypothetical protein
MNRFLLQEKDFRFSLSSLSSSRIQLSPAMKHTLLTLLSLVTLASCATGPSAQTGSVLGALGGAAAGGIIGNQSGRGLEGAAIGGALGALGGAALGNAKDVRNQQQQQQQAYPQPGGAYPQPAYQGQRPAGYYPNGQPYYR